MATRAIFAALLVLSPPLSAGTSGYSDQTAAAGITASYGAANPGFLAGGVVGDFDNDGFQDLFYPSGGDVADKLYMNQGNGTFADQASARGVGVIHRSTAAAVGDYNGDGWLDIYVTSLGPEGGEAIGHHRLYRNDGNGSFTDVAAAAGVAQSSALGADGWGAAWGDYDLDGDLDLAVAGWRQNDGNRLFRNNGDGSFTDVTSSAGLGSLTGISGFCPRFVDMNEDRYPEIIWVGDFTTSRYYINDGDGTFTDFTAGSGTNQDGTEMGMTVADWDEDGDFDFYVTTISTNNLYINQGSHVYQNQADAVGVADTGWGWGTVAIDFDHDTLVDLVATAQNGRNYAFENTSTGGDLSFSEVGVSLGIGGSIDGRGLSNFDYDNDGDQDLVVFPHAGSVKLYRNDLTGSDIHWLRIFLDTSGVPGLAPDGIGSVIELTLGGRTLLGRIDGGSNYLSQSELSAHFGLGSATTVDQVRVLWPNGETTVLEDVASDQILEIPAAGPLFADGFELGDVSAWSSSSGL